MGLAEQLSAELTFHEAFDVWISARVMRHATLVSNAKYISERTEWDYRQYARALEKFFVGVRLCDISDGMLYSYQHDRAFAEGAWEQQAGANRIRKEIGMLVRMLTAAKLWSVEREEGFRPPDGRRK